MATATLLAAGLLVAVPGASADSFLTDPLTTASSRATDTILIAQAEPARPEARAMVQLMNQIDGLNRELNKLRGKVEELSNSIANAEKRQRDMYLDLDTRLRQLETSNSQILGETSKTNGALSELRTRVERLEQAAANGSIPPPVTSRSTNDRQRTWRCYAPMKQRWRSTAAVTTRRP